MSQSILQLQRELINLTLKLQNEILTCNQQFPATTQSAFNANHQCLIGMINSLPVLPTQPILSPPTIVSPPTNLSPVSKPTAPAPAAPVRSPDSSSESSEGDETDWEAAEEAALAELEAAIALQS